MAEMRSFSVLLKLALCVVVSSTAVAQKPAPKVSREGRFVEALRQRGYFDYAQLYLDEVEKNPASPAEFKVVIPYERAITFLEAGRQAASPTEKTPLYDRAVGFLDQFVKANPNHALAADANSQRGRILLGKARVEVWQSQSPSNASNRATFQETGRAQVLAARKIFQVAHDQYMKAWKAFPTFVDRVQQADLFEKRKRSEALYMRAQYDLALCTYEQAQTHDRGSEPYVKLATQAANEFETIHTRYRSQVLGLYARMWQGKCFEEQDDINKAMGIYKELLGHPGGSATMRVIQDQVLLFQLICLNHEEKKDYLLVINQSAEWLGKRTTRQRRAPGALGILWEQVRAQESLAGERTKVEKDRNQLLTAALANCRFIQRWPSKYKDVALFKMRELQVKLKGAAVDPQDFDTAFGLAHDRFKKIKQHNEALAAAKAGKKPAAEIKKVSIGRDEHLTSTLEMLQTALGLVDRDTPKEDLDRARFYMAYVYYQQRQNYEAAVLGDFISRHAGPKAETMALDAAAIAMASHVRSYIDSSTEELKQQSLRLIESTATRILSKWPESSRAQDTRLQLAQVYEGKQPLEAAKHYSQVAENSAVYAEAQTRAGQQFLRAWLDANSVPPASRPLQKDLDGWLASAQQHLRNGITRTEKSTPATVKAPELLIAAKVSLAQILNNSGKYQAAVDLLVKAPHGVIAAIGVPDETSRPEKGVQRREFASLAAQLLLRAQIGLRKLDAAQTAMELLEKIAGAAEGEAVTELYRQLGDELKQELDRLATAGEKQRVAEVLAAFEEFLGRLRQRPDQTFNTLIWIAETYSGLGQGASGEAQATTFFGHAASSYQQIIDRADALIDDEVKRKKLVPGVTLRLANCRRHQGSFEEAQKLIVALAKSQPLALDVQFEAATLYQAWGNSGRIEQFDKAIVGVESERVLGWSQIALYLQRLIDGGSKESDRYRDRRWEARYNQLQCRIQHAGAASDSNKKTDQLKRARSEIQGMMMVTSVVDPRWAPRYDVAYRKILEELGEPVISLAEYREKYKPTAVAAVAKVPVATPTAAVGAAAVAGTTGGSVEPGTSMLGLIFAGVLLAGGGIGVVFMIKGSSRKKRPRRRYAPDAAPEPRTAEKKAGRSRKSGKQAASSGRGKSSARPRRQKPPTRPES
ncbi:MAG: hypothetical protein VYA62_07410 [Planctomycetota bacterium]|nr:hypothetical protein [Planctomycetota bacterium]